MKSFQAKRKFHYQASFKMKRKDIKISQKVLKIEVENPETSIPGLIHAYGSFSDEFKDHEDL